MFTGREALVDRYLDMPNHVTGVRIQTKSCNTEELRGKLCQSRRMRDLHLLQNLPHQHHDEGRVVHL
jgi:hypothetical protein